MAGIAARWADLLDLGLAQTHRLRAALLTSYRPPDTGFLVENLLPGLLGVDRGLTEDATERNLFFADLIAALTPLQRRITLVSSAANSAEGREAGARQYPWLLRDYARWYAVGATDDVTQHAKLWMLHWIPKGSGNGKEKLQLVISSANLTLAAFRDQLQAGWSHTATLTAKSSSGRLDSWGKLPDFLGALEKQIVGKSDIGEFRDLLGRAQCPRGVHVLASVPGAHDAGCGWGLDAVGALATRHRAKQLRILSPYIGHFGSDRDHGALSDWSSALGIPETGIEIAWIDADHPWAANGHWHMPAGSAKALLPRLRRIVPQSHSGQRTRLHAEHVDGDDRWSHAKLYGFTLRRGKAVVVTSANFSSSAWGRWRAKRLEISNFELGVWIDGAAWPVRPASLPRFAPGERPCCSAEMPEFEGDDIAWAQAVWNGKTVTCEVRTRGARPTARVRTNSGVQQAISRWTRKARVPARWRGSAAWARPEDPPLTVTVHVGESVRVLPVADERPARAGTPTPIPEIAPARLQAIEDARLLERYGGRAMEDALEVTKRNGNGHGSVRADGQYTVLAFARARELFATIDAWQAALDRADADRGHVLADGKKLTEVLARLAKESAESEPGSRVHVAAACAKDDVQARLEDRDE